MRITLSIEMLMVNICYKSKGFVAAPPLPPSPPPLRLLQSLLLKVAAEPANDRSSGQQAVLVQVDNGMKSLVGKSRQAPINRCDYSHRAV